MNFESDQIITIEDIDYYITSVIDYEGSQYLYVAQLDDEEDINGNFLVYRYDDVNNTMVHITDSKKMKKLLLLFAKDIGENLKSGDNNE